MDLQFISTFRPDAAIEEEAGRIMLKGQFGALNLSGLEKSLPGLIEHISAESYDEKALAGWAMSEKGMKGLTAFNKCWEVLQENACISSILKKGGKPLARINPLGFGFRFDPKPVGDDDSRVLSRFALLRRRGADLLLECPKGWAEIVCMEPRFSTLLFALCRPCTPAALAEKSGLSEDELRAFLSMLECAGAVCGISRDGMPEEENQSSLAQWDVHDLYFHSRSRLGRHANGWASTYRFKDRFPPLPQVKEPMSDEVISLSKPAGDSPCPGDGGPGFFPVLEKRESRREYSETPISLKELGEFLYRSFRVKQKYDDELGGVTFRPTPGGGALHSLELYVLVKQCQGLEPGFYHYHPLLHQLEKISGPGAMTERMLFLGKHMMLNKDDPQVEIVFASRFQRIQWKYESIAYSVILKDVGCLYQTMYLVAEAMDLAGVALGGGDADLFAAISRLDYFAEGSVGAFMLGSRKHGQD